MLQHADCNHSCEPNRPRVIAELLKHKMKTLVRADPVQPVEKAIRKVRVEAAEKYGEEKDFYLHLIAELGSDSALERQLLRVRAEIYGSTPRSRDEVNPIDFFEKVYGEKHDVVVLDSNSMSDGWREALTENNPDSEFEWEKVTSEIIAINEEMNNDDDIDDSSDNVEEEPMKDLPKRVLVFTSLKLLKQLARNLKCSVDGTFKSCCSLWKQQFILMIKDRGVWLPIAFGWLPDKSETSYRIFFFLLKQKLKEMNLELAVSSVISDFELNILKSVDSQLKTQPTACFFHFKNTFQRRSDRKGFKSRYEKDEHFHNFINQSSAVFYLPIALVEKGLKHVESKFQFEDEKAQTFKADFMKYIYNFWVNGPIPVKVWIVFGRSDDLSNNHQEGYNSKFNKELNVTHPSPGVLLCHVKSQITLSEEKLIQIQAGLKRPAQRRAYKILAERRLNLKKNLLEALERKDDNAIDIFLTSMGHNVSSALMSGRVTEYKETRSKDTCSNAQDSNDISNRVPSNEQSALEVLENIDTYEKRNIGSSKKPEWHKEKCISCNFGFNTRFIPIKCDKCGKFVHVKAMCLKDHNGKHHCKKCLPAEILSNEAEVDVANFMSVVENGFKCTKCDLVTKSKFNLKRHIYRVHAFDDRRRK